MTLLVNAEDERARLRRFMDRLSEQRADVVLQLWPSPTARNLDVGQVVTLEHPQLGPAPRAVLVKSVKQKRKVVVAVVEVRGGIDVKALPLNRKQIRNQERRQIRGRR